MLAKEMGIIMARSSKAECCHVYRFTHPKPCLLYQTRSVQMSGIQANLGLICRVSAVGELLSLVLLAYATWHRYRVTGRKVRSVMGGAQWEVAEQWAGCQEGGSGGIGCRYSSTKDAGPGQSKPG